MTIDEALEDCLDQISRTARRLVEGCYEMPSATQAWLLAQVRPLEERLAELVALAEQRRGEQG